MKKLFIQKILNKINGLKRINIQGKENQIEFRAKKIIVEGNNNIVQSNSKFLKIKVLMHGNNNKLLIEENVSIQGGSIIIGTNDCPVNNCTVHIGKNTTSNGFDIILLEHNSTVTIGEDCMFSNGIMISCSDTHSILDSDNKITNIGKFIKIGDHVWCGQGVRICKNVEIKENSIIGIGSIVTKSFDKTNIIIAGNPAQIVKENINWDRRRPSQYIEENCI